MIETATFICSICNEPSLDICVYCTKDTCRNHRCERCKRCSDCCECDVPLVEAPREAVAAPERETQENPVLPDAAEEILPAPPEASEEPDLNIPAPAVLEHSTEEIPAHSPESPAEPEPLE